MGIHICAKTEGWTTSLRSKHIWGGYNEVTCYNIKAIVNPPWSAQINLLLVQHLEDVNYRGHAAWLKELKLLLWRKL